MESAEWWLNFTRIINSRELMNFQIYTTENELIGGCGFMSMPTDEPAEFGYWTAPPYWNKGVQTAAVKRLLAYGFQELRIAEVVAYAYSWNDASARVLHKAGLTYQGIIPNKMTVKGRRIDCHHFTMTRAEWEAER
jgi:ribosomal-protein-alanine N-acetyltransferase